MEIGVAWACALMALGFSGCASIRPGIYTYKDPAGILIQTEYRGDRFTRSYYDANCLWMEIRGKWKLDAAGTTMRIIPEATRSKLDCKSKWDTIDGSRVWDERIRGIRYDSYEMLMEADESAPAKWQTYFIQ